MTDLIGKRFGNYTATRLLGEGGFGAVYLAEHPYVARKAAVKVLHPLMARDTELVARFFNEARAASAIRHPNIVEVFDAGLTDDGMPYILMELLEGESLKDRVARLGRLPPVDAVRYVCDAASALQSAHTAGIVHRDLKPENIFVVPVEGRRGVEQVKILDFGIAKLSGSMATDMVRTQIGQFMGSPVYMSPEQWLAAGDIDKRTDVYSLGVILFELLAGRPPFQGESPFDLRDLHLQSPVPALRSLGVSAPPAAEQVIKKAMAKKPADRFADMAQLLAAFGVRPSEPMPVSVRSQPAMRSTPAGDGRTTTTLSSGTGEMNTADGGDDIPLQSSGKRRMAILGSGAIVVVAVIVLAVARPRAPESAGRPQVPVTAQQPAPPKAPPETPPAVVTPPPVEKPAPPKVAIMRVRSQPSGASVIDAASGRTLGKTPFDRTWPAGQEPRRLRLIKRGFGSKVVEEPAPGAGVDQDVILDREKVNERPEDVIL